MDGSGIIRGTVHLSVKSSNNHMLSDIKKAMLVPRSAFCCRWCIAIGARVLAYNKGSI